MKAFVTGGAGFIGSHLVDRLIKYRYNVVVYDNLSTGKLSNLPRNINLVRDDLSEQWHLTEAMKECDIVFHLAANADVRHGTEHPNKDLTENTIGTFNVLEAMRKNKIKDIVFSSTGSIYGEPVKIPTPEDAPFPVQTSLYGASKLASEGLIQAYCHAYDMRCWIFRFVSVLGERYSHGHVIDFVNQLKEHPDYLNVLGDGTQTKSYMDVSDCVEGIFAGFNSSDRINIFNLGTDETITVRQSTATITKELGVNPQVNYSGGRRGWIGDIPLIHLDCRKIRAYGWKPKYTIQESIKRTVRYLK